MPCKRTSLGLSLALGPLALVLALAPGTATAGVTGVALVHGTSKHTNAIVD
jgi:hypothetical protein